MQFRRIRLLPLVLCLAGALLVPGSLQAADPEPGEATEVTTNAVPAEVAAGPSTAAIVDELRSVRDQLSALQQQYGATEIEHNGELKEQTARLNASFKQLEATLARQHQREIESMQHVHRQMLIAIAVIALAGVIGVLLLGTWFQARNVRSLVMGAQRIASREMSHQLPPPTDTAARLNAAMAALTDRLNNLELLATSVTVPSSSQSIQGGASAGGTEAESATTFIDRGALLLKENRCDEALEVFEKALELQPGNPDAYVKKGAALEKLRRLDEALGCFDTALALDARCTIAYLYKGRILQELQRDDEALDCYEKALSRSRRKGEGEVVLPA